MLATKRRRAFVVIPKIVSVYVSQSTQTIDIGYSNGSILEADYYELLYIIMRYNVFYIICIERQ